jgi:electron transfer flavoprotein alpha/beta subunit
MGSQSSEGNNGKTPMLTAEYLGWPCISQVFALDVMDETRLRVRSMSDQGEVVQTVSLPCVLSAGNIADSWLRVPTLKDRMRLGKKPIEFCTLDDLGLDEAICAGDVFTELTDLRRTVPKRLGVLLAEGTAEERAQQLYDGFLKERLAKV